MLTVLVESQNRSRKLRHRTFRGRLIIPLEVLRNRIPLGSKNVKYFVLKETPEVIDDAEKNSKCTEYFIKHTSKQRRYKRTIRKIIEAHKLEQRKSK